MAPNPINPDAEAVRENYDVTTIGVDDSARLSWFLSKAFAEAVKMVADNSQHPRADGDGVSRDAAVEAGPLRPDNVREIEVRDGDLSDPTVRVWLHNAPTWANTADTRKLVNVSSGSDVHAVIDVRPF